MYMYTHIEIYKHMYYILCIEINRAAALSPRVGTTCRREREFFFVELMFFSNFYEFFHANFEKMQIFKNFRFRQIFGLRCAIFISGFPSARNYRVI